ncbi:peptidylprolyl isomerase [Desulfothermus okinawensis JCM 13304]
MEKAKQGDKVKVHYKGFLEDGTVFDSSFDHDPLEFTIGNGEIIPGFENAVVGMGVGETKVVDVAPEDGYGEYNEMAKLEVPRKNLPEHINPEIGMMLQLTTPQNTQVLVRVTDMDDTNVVLDANHPLAGKNLKFEIQLVDLVAA